MAMKKKFLGLAMAAAITLPTVLTSAAYAATTTVGDKQVVEMGKDESENVTIPVTGTIRNKNGQVADRIEVELPSKMAFAVEADGTLPQTKYSIKNNSANVNIDLSVFSFSGGRKITSETDKGIQVVPASKLTGTGSDEGADKFYRNQVALSLTNTNGGKSIDLGSFDTLDATAKSLGTINASSMTELTLTGQAGQKASTEQLGSDNKRIDIDGAGTTDTFELVFSIKKAN